MRILHISDTHNQHRLLHDLPAADLIIHSGDITFSGAGKDVVDFVDWFGGLDYRILITHRPPYGILDSRKNISYGCPDLLLAVLLKVTPRYHLFGHVHDAYGIQKVCATTFVNASLLNEAYQLTNEPVVLDV